MTRRSGNCRSGIWNRGRRTWGWLVPARSRLSETRRSACSTAPTYFAEHFAEVPAIVVACGYIDGVHPTDTELGRLSIVGGGSIYPAVQNFLLGCREAGLGTALTTLLCMYEPQVAEMLDIPEGVATAAHIAVGYRSTPFPRKLDRLPLPEIVFNETWGDSAY